MLLDQPHSQKSIVQWCLLLKIRTKQWYVIEYICFSLITPCDNIYSFSEFQTRQFWRLIKPSRWKCVWIFCIKFSNYGRQTFIIFKILFNNEDVVVSYNAPFLLILNSQLSNCSFFRVANNLMQIQILP